MQLIGETTKSEALPHVKTYMPILQHTGGCDNLVALWSPKSSKGYAEFGDIGCFDGQGGFHVFFNLYLDRDGNLARGHEPPQQFIPFRERDLGPLVWQTDYDVDPRCNVRLHGVFETSAGQMSSQFIGK